MITVRVSAEEYNSLRAMTAIKGYRNVSELARAALQSIITDDLAPHALLAMRVNEYATRLAELTRKVERLTLERSESQP